MDELSFLGQDKKKQYPQPVNSLGQTVNGAIDNMNAPQQSNYALAPWANQQQPQQEPGYFESALKGVKAQAASVFGGQADFVSGTLGTDGQVGDYLQSIARANQRNTNYEINDILANPIKYITDPSGLTYDLGGAVGSSGALGLETAALMAALPSGVVTGVTTAIGAGTRAIPWLAKTLESPAGKILIGNILKTPMEAVSEGGNVYREMTRNDDGSVNQNADIGEARRAMYSDAALNSALLTFTNSLESLGLGGLINSSGGKNAVMKVLKGAALDFLQNGYEEGAQQGIAQYTQGKGTARQILDPTVWTPQQQTEAFIGGISGAVQGGGMTAGGMVANKYFGNGQTENPPQGHENVQQEQDNTAQPQKSEPSKEYRPAIISGDIEDKNLANTVPEAVNGVHALNSWAYDQFGKDIIVSGGWRSEENNRAVNGHPNSHHLYGQAVDMDLSSFTKDERTAIEQQAKAMGFKTLYHDAGTGEHLHVAVDDGTSLRTNIYTQPMGNASTEASATPQGDFLDQYINDLINGDNATANAIGATNPEAQMFNEALQNSREFNAAGELTQAEYEERINSLNDAIAEAEAQLAQVSHSDSDPSSKAVQTAKNSVAELKRQRDNYTNLYQKRYGDAPARFNRQERDNTRPSVEAKKDSGFISTRTDNELENMYRKMSNLPDTNSAKRAVLSEMQKRGVIVGDGFTLGSNIVPYGSNKREVANVGNTRQQLGGEVSTQTRWSDFEQRLAEHFKGNPESLKVAIANKVSQLDEAVKNNSITQDQHDRAVTLLNTAYDRILPYVQNDNVIINKGKYYYGEQQQEPTSTDMAVLNDGLATEGNKDIANRNTPNSPAAQNNAVGPVRVTPTRRLEGKQALPEHREEYAGSNIASNMVERRRKAMAEKRTRIGNNESPSDIITTHRGSKTRSNQYREGNPIVDAYFKDVETKEQVKSIAGADRKGIGGTNRTALNNGAAARKTEKNRLLSMIANEVYRYHSVMYDAPMSQRMGYVQRLYDKNLQRHIGYLERDGADAARFSSDQYLAKVSENEYNRMAQNGHEYDGSFADDVPSGKIDKFDNYPKVDGYTRKTGTNIYTQDNAKYPITYHLAQNENGGYNITAVYNGWSKTVDTVLDPYAYENVGKQILPGGDPRQIKRTMFSFQQHLDNLPEVIRNHKKKGKNDTNNVWNSKYTKEDESAAIEKYKKRLEELKKQVADNDFYYAPAKKEIDGYSVATEKESLDSTSKTHLVPPKTIRELAKRAMAEIDKFHDKEEGRKLHNISDTLGDARLVRASYTNNVEGYREIYQVKDAVKNVTYTLEYKPSNKNYTVETNARNQQGYIKESFTDTFETQLDATQYIARVSQLELGTDKVGDKNNEINKAQENNNGNAQPKQTKQKKGQANKGKKIKQEELQETSESALGDTITLNAVSARDEDSRAYMTRIMKEKGMTDNEISDLFNVVDSVVDAAEKIAKDNGFKTMEDWLERNINDPNLLYRVTDNEKYKATFGHIPTRSSFKKNGEYELNFDLGALCTKRESMDALIYALSQQVDGAELIQNLGPTQMEALKSMLKEEGFLTACDVCFVETKRVRALNDANKWAFEWKTVLEAAGIDDDVKLGERESLTPEQQERLNELAGNISMVSAEEAFNKYIANNPKLKERVRQKVGKNGDLTKGADLDSGITSSKAQKIAKLILEDIKLAGDFDPALLLTTHGTDYLVRTFAHTNIANTIASMYGAATAKPLEGFNIYDSLSWYKDFDSKNINLQHIYDIGGFRAQSFTDFNPILFVDYVQMFADLQARQLPIHLYTKVPSLVEIFGRTGAMINMSLVPEIVDGVDAAHAGLDKGGNYAWAKESFPVDKCMKLRKREDFGGRVGNIAVGVSDAHILKMLDDDDIDYIIPYHSSGMPASVKTKTGLNKATDYTKVQETKKPTGWKENENDPERLFNSYMHEYKDARKAAEAYKAWCKRNGCTPKFEQFSNHPNYYKVLIDFRAYDNNGKPVIQGPVKMELTDNWQEVLKEALADRSKQADKIKEMSNAESSKAEGKKILDRARDILKKQRLDSDAREVMVSRLNTALGKQNVQCKKQKEFLDQLEKDGGAKQQVELFRNAQGICYGYAKGNKIVLNEDVFNADTPAHEFSHIWAKVAQKMNPELWTKGVELLKTDAKDVWDAVVNDPLYQNLKDDNAIADEVLARITGGLNENLVREMTDPNFKMSKAKAINLALYNAFGNKKGNKPESLRISERLMNFLKDFFTGIRNFFKGKDFNNENPLTYEEFIRMPLKTLWNDSEGQSFKTMLNRLNKGNELGAEQTFSVTSGTFFSGGGLVDYALKSIIDGQFAVEFDKQIAGVYETNNGKHMFNMDVREFRTKDFKGKVDYFHASPVCKNYSGAKANAEELPLDMTTAQATADALRELKPKAFTLENVPKYRNSQAMKLITDALDELGYNYDVDVYDSADYGAATSRKRLLLRAFKDEQLPPKPKPIAKKTGWYSAVEDLIDTLPEAELPQWIEERLNRNNIDVNNLDQPILILHGNKNGTLAYAKGDKPSQTLLASDHDQRIIMPDGRVLKATPRVIARIQGLGDDYVLPKQATLAYRVIGNGVPVKLTQAVFGPMLQQIDNNDSTRLSAEMKEQPKRTVTRQELQSVAEDIVPIRVEKARRDSAYKMYNRKANVGFVHTQGSIGELSGIVAMYVDNKKKLSESQELRDELVQNAWDYKQEQKQGRKFAEVDTDLQTKEGAAYFGRLYVTDKAKAEKLFPKYFEAFESAVAKDKALQEKLANFTDTAEAYYKQTPEGKAKAGITNPFEKPKTNKERAIELFHEAYADWVDDKHILQRVEKQIEEITGKKIDINDSAYYQARMAASAGASRIDMAIKGAETVFGKKAGKGTEERKAWFNAMQKIYGKAWSNDVCYQDIVDEVEKVSKDYIALSDSKDGMSALANYLLANRFLEIWETKPNYKASISRETAQKVVANAPKAIKDAAKMYYAFNNNLIQVMNKEGMLTDAGLEGMKKYTRYCPLFRDYADEAAFDKFMSKISNPNSYVNLSNGIKALTEEGSDRTVLDDPVKSMMRMTASILGKVEKNKVAKKFVAMSDRSGVGNIIIPALDNKGEQLTTANPQESQFTVWINGEKKAYKTIPELYDVLQGGPNYANNYLSLFDNMWVKTPAQTLRKGATISPGFIMANFMKDTMNAWVNSKNGYKPVIGTIRGIDRLVNDKEFRQEYLASGVNMAGYFHQDAKSLQDILDEMAGNKWWQKATMLEKIKTLWDHYETLGELVEQGTRAEEYYRARKNDKSMLEAAIDAKQVSSDFSRAGKKGREVNKGVSFFNAIIQGGDQMIRSAIDHPQRFAAIATGLALSSIMLWCVNQNDPDYEEESLETKMSNWHFKVGDKWVTIPVPQEFGMLTCGSVVATLEAFKQKNPKPVKEWARALVSNMLPVPFPVLYKPVIECIANYDFFFDSPVVAKKYQGLKEEKQINSNTSKVAELAGGVTGYSPIKIDHLIRGYFGGAGAFVARVPNKLLEDGKEPAKYWNEMPLFDRFIRTPSAHPKSVTEFYDLRDEITKEFNTNHSNETDMKYIRKMGTIISGLRKDIEKIKANKVLSSDRKRELINNKNNRILQVAKKAVAQYGNKYL